MSTSDSFIKKYLGVTPTANKKNTAQQSNNKTAGSSAADACTGGSFFPTQTPGLSDQKRNPEAGIGSAAPGVCKSYLSPEKRQSHSDIQTDPF